MMADKREEEERLQTAECQRLQMEIEANKMREENEVKIKFVPQSFCKVRIILHAFLGYICNIIFVINVILKI